MKMLYSLKKKLGLERHNYRLYKLPNKCTICTDGSIDVADSAILAEDIQYNIGCDSYLIIKNKVNISKGVQLTALNGGKIFIGNNVYIGRFVQINAIGGEIYINDEVVCVNDFSIITSWGKVEIGSNTLIAPFCHIQDKDHGFKKNDLIRNQEGEIRPIFIGQDVWLGSGAIVLKGVRINEGAVVGAGSVVTSDIPAYAVAAGNPARILKYRE